ncbi:MAG: phosphatase PAP2 family protein [Acidimicrobiia bacterium]|nr:phosphatase PAP2 family protein [Acidimicrobiia bacterium]
MAAVLEVSVEAPPVAPVAAPRWKLAGAVEIAVVVAFYEWYSVVRHWVAGSTGAAQRNAMHVVAWERTLGIFNEATVQAAALGHPAVMRAAATYYGSAHFVVPAVALAVLYRRDRERYFTWRNALAWTSVLAVAAFALFPTMPPRLLPAAFHFTNVTTSGVDRAFVPNLYNGFAAMPSLHAAFATWSLCALWPVLRSKWTRGLLVTHVALIMAVVLVTANHYYLDLVGGVAVMAAGVLVARRRTPKFADFSRSA